MPPENGGYELEESDDVEGSGLGSWWFAVEEEIKEFKTYGMTLDIQSTNFPLATCSTKLYKRLQVAESSKVRGSIPFF